MRCFCTSVRTFHFAHNYACVERGFLKKKFITSTTGGGTALPPTYTF